MKTPFYILLCVLVLHPLAMFSQTKLAEWNFDYEYSTTTSNDTTYYSPTETALAADPNITTADISGILPNSKVSNSSVYLLTTSTTYTQLKTGYNNYTCRLMFQGPTHVADFTDEASHKNFYQFAFPTAGFDEISLDFAFSSGQNSELDFLEVVYSTNDGATWVDAGKFNPAAGWWIYNPHTLSISAKNKEKVLVRLISDSENTGGTVNFNLDYFTVSGTEYTGGQAVDATSTITWKFDLGTAGQVASYSDNTADYFKPDHVSIGSNIYYFASRSSDGVTFTQVNPVATQNTVDENCALGFNLWPKTGLTFTPTSLSFDCERFGTNGGMIDVAWKAQDGTLTTVATEIYPNRNGTEVTHASIDLSDKNLTPATGECTLLIYIYQLGDTKQVGVANVEIQGTVTGTIADIPTYIIDAQISPVGAGSFSSSPVGNEFDEGTEVTLTASRNFGYTFSKWVDGEGNTLSTDEAYTFILDTNKVITAEFDALVTYSLDLSIVGSKWGEVSLSPEPTNGKYETGTIVTAQVVANPVTSFINWDDNTTQTDRTITMDKDQTISATFDEIPFIVGWDLRNLDPKVSRPGDFYAETTNTGVFSAYRKSDNSTVGWLAHTAEFSPSYPNARIWTADFTNDRRYFMASFSTENYTNIEVKSMMVGSYQVYSKQDLEYSLDGTTFTKLATADLTTGYQSAWTDLNAKLPLEAENQTKVYVRWIADETSTILGSGNDGTAITNVFVFADKTAVNDTIAPKLVSAIPANGSENASATGSITLTFDEKVSLGTGDITLGSEILTPVFGAKTAKFTYEKLAYNTEYTFTVPSGAITDVSGNIFEGTTLTFRTMNRPEPTVRLFDAVVALDGSGDYDNLQSAIDAAPTNRAIPWIIFIKNGRYDGHVNIPSNKPFIHLIGQETDKVIVSDDRLSGDKGDGTPVYHVSEGATVVVNSSDCYFENITFQNAYGYERQAGPQALAMYTNNNHMTFKNCTLRSYQDTYLTSTRSASDRHYLVNCRIEGAVDYIYGAGDVFFDECVIYNTRPTGGYIVAPSHPASTLWGYVFSNCIIDGNPGVITYYGRPWHNSPKTVFLNSTLKCDIYSVGWYYTMGAIPAIFADYGTMDAEGNLVDLSNRISEYQYTDNGTLIKGTAKNNLTDEEAATYTYENVILRSGDSWDPKVLTESTAKPASLSLSDNVLTWDATSYAMCYVITRNDSVVGFTTEASYTDDNMVEGETYIYKIQAASGSGALSEFSNELNSSTVGVENKLSTNSIQAFGKTHAIQVTGLHGPSNIRIYNINGQLVKQQRLTQNTAEFDISHGIYIVTISSENGASTFKVAVK